MGVKVTKRKYNEIYTAGDTDWLLGNTGDFQKLVVSVDVSIDYFATQASPIQIDYVNNLFEIVNGETWSSYGFDTGMQIVHSFKLHEDTNNDGELNQITTIQNTYNVSNVYGSKIEVLEEIQGFGFESMPVNFGTKKITDVNFTVNQDVEGVKLTYNHILNESIQSQNLSSFIDGTKTQFIYPNFTNVIPGTFVEMEPIGLQSGMAIKKVRVRKLPTDSNTILTRYNVLPTESLGLTIFDSSGSDPQYRTIRCSKMDIETPVQGYQSVIENGYVPVSDSGGGSVFNGAQPQAFLLNDSNDSFTQDIFFNLNVRITSTQNLTPDNNVFRLSVLRYTNGTNMDFVERIPLREWQNAQSLVNDNLNFNGIVNFDINPSDRLVLAVEFYQPAPYDNVSRFLSYQWIEGVLEFSEKNGTLTQNNSRSYEFEICYIIPSFFDSINDFINGTIPEYLQGNKSITDNLLFDFFPEWNNPNVVVSNNLQETARLGNVGWFDENFNELTNDFSVESIEYFDALANQVESIDFSALTKVKVVISGVQNLNSQTECGFGFAHIPIDEDDFKEKTEPLHKNLYLQNGSETNGFNLDTNYTDVFIGYGLNGGSMTVSNVKFTRLNDKIIFEANFEPNTNFFSTFFSKPENDRNYILWISVADSQLQRQFSNRVNLLVDFNSMIKSIPPAGEYEYISNIFIEHPYGEDYQGGETIQSIVQDDILCRLPFLIKNDGSETFDKIIFGVDVFNVGENKSFDLQRFEIDATSFPTQGSTQQINYDSIRGFKLNSGNNKNFVKVLRETQSDTANFNGYIAFFAFKNRWEDWLQKNGVPGEFYDINELNTGFHNDWIHYALQTGYQLNFFVEILATKDGELKLYRNRYSYEIKDYDQNDLLQTTHNYYRNSDNTLLNIGLDPETQKPLGVILSNEDVRIEIEFEIMDDGIWDLSTVYGVTTIEIDFGGGQFEMRQLSSVWERENDNPLKPINGETKLKIEIDQTQKILKTICLVDPEILQQTQKYRITGRVGCYLESNNVYNPGLYESKYESKYE